MLTLVACRVGSSSVAACQPRDLGARCASEIGASILGQESGSYSLGRSLLSCSSVQVRPATFSCCSGQVFGEESDARINAHRNRCLHRCEISQAHSPRRSSPPSPSRMSPSGSRPTSLAGELATTCQKTKARRARRRRRKSTTTRSGRGEGRLGEPRRSCWCRRTGTIVEDSYGEQLRRWIPPLPLDHCIASNPVRTTRHG
jgi:hypothetical protein